MTTTLNHALQYAHLRDAGAIHDIATQYRYTPIDPLPLALSAVTLLSGGEYEIKHYQVLCKSEKMAGQSVFKLLRLQVASKILAHCPEIEAKVYLHPAVQQKTASLALERMPKPLRTTRLLAKLLLDVEQMQHIQRKGFFAWDDGSYQAALLIDYLWRYTTDSKHWLTQKPKQLCFSARELAHNLFKQYPDNPWLCVLQARYRQSWYLLNQQQQNNGQAQLENLIVPNHNHLNLVVAGSLLDLGIRYENTRLIEHSIDALQALLTPKKNHAALLLAQTWLHVIADDVPTTQLLLAKLKRKRADTIRSATIPLLERAGEHLRAKQLRKHYLSQLAGRER